MSGDERRAVGAEARAGAQRLGEVREVGRPRLFAHACGYLPDRTALTEARFFEELPPSGYHALLVSGYRRFGELVFRPRCLVCNLCISYRIIVAEARMPRRHRRALKANRDVRVEVGPAAADAAAVEVANDFYEHRSARKGWQPSAYTESSYQREFVNGPLRTREVRYYDGSDGQLLGVGLFDEVPDGLSAIIFHYRERWLPRSPGAFNVLTLLERARAQGLDYLYLGYWVPGSASTTYKADYRPGEYLTALGWRRLPDDHPSATSPLPGVGASSFWPFPARPAP